MRKIFAILALAALVGVPVAADAFQASAVGAMAWNVDANHTEVNFSVNHFFTPVTGSFDDFEVILEYDAKNPENSTVEARIRVASVNTGNAKRDDHLRSADWFEAEKYPYMTFKSTSVKSNGHGGLLARGQLTIKGVSHEVELPITLLGTQQIPEKMQAMLGGSKEVASFKASTAVERGEFGIGVGSWAATMVVGSEVGIEILLEAHRS